MNLELDPVEVRVLGALIEKDLATPEYYPLSLNALVNACNQKSNREPVVSYDDQTVKDALERLRARHLSFVRSGDGRVLKYGHDMGEAFNLGRRELALLAVMLLRGPQTLNELRERTQRMHNFDDLEAVESTLNRMSEFVVQLPAQPGWRELRWMHLLAGEPRLNAEPAQTVATPAARADRMTQLEESVRALQEQMAELQRQFADFRRQFE